MFAPRALSAALVLPTLISAIWLEPGYQQRVLSIGQETLYIARPESDPAGKRNLGTRIQVTSKPNSTLYCALDGDHFTSGYAHFTNSDGVEDKHMFWWLFEARQDPSNAPVVLVFAGGPGSSGMPCRLARGRDGNGTAIASQCPWTDEVNVLAIDHPVGVGFSYGVQSSLHNSSERAAWDVDDFLQAFWVEFPQLSGNQFMIQSASFGGNYIPHIVDVIHTRNMVARADPLSSRLPKMPDAVFPATHHHDDDAIWPALILMFRWWIQANCHDNPIVNSTGCDLAISTMPACLDAVQYAYEQPTIDNRYSATILCHGGDDKIQHAGFNGRNPYHATQFCDIDDVDDCFPQMQWLDDIMRDDRTRSAVGVPEDVKFEHVSWERIYKPFEANGEMVKSAYRLLAPAIDAGLRVMVYNGNTDGVCSWRSNLSWNPYRTLIRQQMTLLQTKHREAFRSAPQVVWPGIGWIRQVGAGAGVFTFVSVDDAGHFVEWDREEAFREILIKWLRNETLVS
ncbi:alpha/beta-hydrolase [Laetiporus sulphureus 93-53]|uniref:carboxypeptidase C n=1 Tax=Laetiporus sulphureus 93-53 TaxID=1314785 RepID=A0A165FAU5_9APHY|nr:alpha/beta-hydrolase [Laetiporus sulphureus 93-53]KZT08688.1 alpha/beta-hydrolase [Laetiporus sulphureus 93-53]